MLVFSSEMERDGPVYTVIGRAVDRKRPGLPDVRPRGTMERNAPVAQLDRAPAF